MVEIGKIVKLVGLKGEIKIETSIVDYFLTGAELMIDDTRYTIVNVRMHKGMPVVQLEGYEHISDVEHLLHKMVYAQSDDVLHEDDEFLESQLIGLSVLEDGIIIGEVCEILDTPHDDILVVRGEQEILIPLRQQFVQEINLDKGEIIVELIEGMF